MSANRLKLSTDKKELLWTGSKYNLSVLEGCGLALRLGSDVVELTDHVRLLGVTLSADTSTIPACVASTGYATTVYNCNDVLAESPKAITDNLQRVLNAAARIVAGTRKYDRGLTNILHNELHLLSVPQRVKFKLGTMIFRCLHHSVQQYLTDFFAARSQLYVI